MTRRLHAYVLAADPTWIRSTVRQWYPYVDLIVVSYDQRGVGWTGAEVPVEECLKALRSIDVGRKLRFEPGVYANDTEQRQAALASAGEADWVLQLDTDEFLPTPELLLDMLDHAENLGLPAVEWPMRVLFRHTRGQFLEVVGNDGQARYEYPGPIAVRPSVTLIDARRTNGPYLRPTVVGDLSSLQLSADPSPQEHRLEILAGDAAIIHNSWGRPSSAVRSKINSWGHHLGWRTTAYFWLVWFPSPLTRRLLRNFHPLSRRLWPRLDVCTEDIHALLSSEDLT